MAADTVPTLVEPDWLEARLDEPDLRILDCTVHLEFDEETGDRYSEPCRDEWAKAHIPGSAYADLLNELSVTDDPEYPFEVPSAEAVADAMEALGVGDDSRVVLYDADGNKWAARVWWLLRAFGFDRAGVLNGGWKRWTDEDRPVSSEPPAHEPATFTPDPRPELVADKQEVLASINDGDRCLVNALRPEDHAGTGVVKYDRPGRIPDSVNVPTVGDAGIIDQETHTFPPIEELRRRFTDAGATDADRVITYCGGGIAASTAALALSLVGVDDVAVYDGSLSEWGADPELPMETDESPG